MPRGERKDIRHNNLNKDAGESVIRGRRYYGNRQLESFLAASNARWDAMTSDVGV
jgi:hypothetical protein